MFIEIFGWVAAAIGVASNVPQLARIFTARTSAGVSVHLWQVAAASAGSMVVICTINLAVYLVRRARHRVSLAV